MAPRILDLFCKAGGASVGYSRAGFEVVGVDLEPQPRYPFLFVQADALDFVWRNGKHFDAIHASPPCQAHTTMSNRWRGAGGKADGHVDLIALTRNAIRGVRGGTTRPYVIENVPGARPLLRDALTLSGGAFGLGVERPRLFESNALLVAPPRVKVANPLGVYGKAADGRRLFTRKDGSIQRAAKGTEEAATAMGIDWMTWDELREAIPPAYTEHLGLQLIAYLTARQAA